MAAPARPEAVGVGAELLFVVWLQQRPEHLLHQLVGPGRDAQRSQLAVRLLDVGPANGSPLEPSQLELGDDLVDFLDAHTVHRLLGGPLRCRARVPVYLAVSAEVWLTTINLQHNSERRSLEGVLGLRPWPTASVRTKLSTLLGI